MMIARKSTLQRERAQLGQGLGFLSIIGICSMCTPENSSVTHSGSAQETEIYVRYEFVCTVSNR